MKFVQGNITSGEKSLSILAVFIFFDMIKIIPFFFFTPFKYIFTLFYIARPDHHVPGTYLNSLRVRVPPSWVVAFAGVGSAIWGNSHTGVRLMFVFRV